MSRAGGAEDRVVTPPQSCVTVNEATSVTAVTLGANATYAFEWTTTDELELTGFEMFIHAVTANHELLPVGVHLPDPVSGGPGALVSTGTLAITPTASWSMASVQNLSLIHI